MKDIYILGIESSCDDTSAAVLKDGVLLSNVTASQAVHEAYGGVVPELASRAHQQNVVPVVDQAIKKAGITKEQLSAIAFTRWCELRQGLCQIIRNTTNRCEPSAGACDGAFYS